MRGTLNLCINLRASRYLTVYFLLLQDLVKRYSEFINFPIYLWASKEVDVEVPADDDESNDEEESSMRIYLPDQIALLVCVL